MCANLEKYFSAVTISDMGSYECQISLEKKLSRFVQLTVQGNLQMATLLLYIEKVFYISVPFLEIEGPEEVFTQSGSSVQLLCTLAFTKQQNPKIVW